MQTLDLLDRLRASRRATFTARDVAKLVTANPASVSMRLLRLRQAGRILEVKRGIYTLPETREIAIASAVGQGYVSFLSALAHHGLTTQIPREFAVVTGRRPGTITFRESVFRLVHFPAFRRFGFRREPVESALALIAEPEKAVVDACYQPKYCPLPDALQAIREGDLKPETLLAYAERMRSTVTVKRIGHLLEAAGHPVPAPRRLRAVYERLDPLGPARGPRDRKWKLIINRELEDP